MSEYPLVSVIIPMYQRMEFVGPTVESVRRQTYPQMEIIVTDDGSGEEYLSQLRLPPEVTLLRHQECRGPAAAKNTALRQARGAYIAFMDSDDLWAPDKVAAQVALLQRHPEVGLAYCAVQCIDAAGQPLDHQPLTRQYSGWTFPQMLQSCFIRTPSAVLIRREVLERCGLFDESIKAADDWDMWLSITRQFPIIADPAQLTLYRVHPNQITFDPVRVLKYDVPVRAKWYHWAQREAPEWERQACQYYGHTLQKLGKAQAACAGDLRSAFYALWQAVRVNPWDLRAYTRLLRLPFLAMRGRRTRAKLGTPSASPSRTLPE